MCVGLLSRQRFSGVFHWRSFNTRFSYRYVGSMSQLANQSAYDGTCAATRKVCAVNSSAMRSWSSIGPVGDCGSIERIHAAMWSLPMVTMAVAAARRASSSSGETPGGGHGDCSSHRRRFRNVRSSARRCDSAVEPVRGNPTPRSSTATSCSSISGCRAYQSSICNRFTRGRTSEA